MEDRLKSVEDKFGFLEHRVDQLDEVIRELYAATDALRRDLERIQSLVERVESKVYEGQSEDETMSSE